VEILLLVPGAAGPSGQPLPALDLLGHGVRTGPAYCAGSPTDAVLVNAVPCPVRARDACRLLRAGDLRVPLIAVVAESGLPAVGVDWGVDDVLLAGAGPAEVQARLQLAAGRLAAGRACGPYDAGRLHIDGRAFTAALGGRRLDLTFREFELLRFLALHPDHVFTRDRLLREVWGFDFFGGCRTVDMHVRRLRAKLGVGNEWMIATVRNVGYKLDGARRAAR
jgi:DNA-binding response OmpR family regulator